MRDIRDLFFVMRRPMRVKEVQEHIDIAYPHIWSNIKNLVLAGSVKKVGRGLYEANYESEGTMLQNNRTKFMNTVRYPVEVWPIPKFINHIVKGAKHRSNKKGFEFSLTNEGVTEIWERQDGKCLLTGIPLTTVRGEGWQVPTNASLDRIDHTIGYTPDNVRLLCWQANRMRGDLTDDELFVFSKLIFKTWLKRDTKDALQEEEK